MAFARNLRDHKRKRTTLATRPWTFEMLESRRVLATIAGTVYEDVNANNILDAEEPRISNAVVYIDSNNNGQLDSQGFGLDPDEYREGAVMNNSRPSIFPSGTGIDNEPAFQVRALKDTMRATTGERVFGADDAASWSSDRRLRFDFTLPVDAVSLEAVGASLDATASVRLDAFAENGDLLESATLSGLANSEAGRLSIERTQKDIRFVVAQTTTPRGAVAFDNLLADHVGGELSTVTSSTGFYSFLNQPAGQLTVAQEVPQGYVQTTPATAHTTIDGAANLNLNFGNRTSTIVGVTFNDVGVIGTYEPATDTVLAGSVVYLDLNRNGVADEEATTMDPDSFLPDQVLDFVSPKLRITTADADNLPVAEQVTASVDSVVGQDGQLFAHAGNTAWTTDRRLRVDFSSPASSVQLDFIAASDTGPERGTLVAFSHAGEQIANVTSSSLQKGQLETMSIQRATADIAFVVAYTSESTSNQGRLDNLTAQTVSEPVAITNEDGEYSFRPLTNGAYRVAALVNATQTVSFPEASLYDVELELGEEELDIDFGIRSINQPPEARDDAVTIVEDQSMDIGVLVNDTDADGVLNEGSLDIMQNPLNGTALVTANGFIRYTPNENFAGTDTLIYTVRDDQGALSNSAIVTITVTPVNDAPVAVDDAASWQQLSPTLINVLANDRDVDSQLDPATVRIIDQPTSGVVLVDTVTGNIAYTPRATSGDAFTYVVQDEEGLESNVATVTITRVVGGNAPVARDDSATTLEGTKVNISLLVNDSDADTQVDPNTVTFVTLPSHGTITDILGIVTYQPELGFVGRDSFTYQVRDTSGLSSNTAEVSIDVTQRDFPYQNPINSLDTNGDGFVIPRDALIVINEINNRQFSDPLTGAITVTPEVGMRPIAYFDVTGDGFIVANDVLRIVNFINAQAVAAAAAEPAGEPQMDRGNLDELQAAAVAATFSVDFDAFEDEDEEQA